MKPYITAVFLLYCLSELHPAAADIDGCTFTDKKISCDQYHSSTFPYDANYRTLVDISIKGTFSKMDINMQYTKLRKITLRSDNLTEFDFEPYAKFLKLRAVDVRENNIERVSFTGVHALTGINQIQLTSNKIKTFDGCKDLKQASSLNLISFQDNELEQVDLNCFPKNLGRLYLNFNNIKNLSACHPLRDLTGLTRLSVAENELEVFDFSCVPLSTVTLSLYGNNISQVQNCQALKNLPNLQKLSLAENNLESFDLNCIPTNLKALFLFDNKISRVEPCSSLKALTQLEGLSVDQNQLTSFDLSCLPTKIINLSLANNSISQISSCEILRNFTGLQNLFLNGNNFTSFNFSCLPLDVTNFDLSNNTISQMYFFDTVRQLSGLTRLSLAHNEINNVDFRYLPHNINYLFLHDNLLSHLDFDLLSPLRSIEISVYDNPIACSCKLLVQYVNAVQSSNVEFQCGNESKCLACSNLFKSYPWTKDTNNLRSYDDEAMGCFTSYLKEASVSRRNDSISKGCIVEKIHDLLPRIVCNYYQHNGLSFHEDFENAESLDISGNFSSFRIDPRCTQLRHIKLRSNSLTAIDMNSFAAFSRLKILDLSSNAIASIMLTTKLASIDEINLNDNSLSTISFISNQSFNLFTNLKRLYAGDNKLETLEIKHLPLQLVELNVRNNLISDVVFDGIELMTSLKFVDFSHNKLEQFPLNRVPGSVEELWLNDNEISNINMDPCNNFHGLQLDIRNNMLNCTCDLSARFITAFADCNIELRCEHNSTCFTCRHDDPLLEESHTSFLTIQHLKNHTAIRCEQVDLVSNAVKFTTSTLLFIVGILLSLLL